MAASAVTMQAQKFALVDMEYILKNIPAYERANEQLNQVSKQWQAEVDALTTEAQTLYKNYQNEVVFLSKEQKQTRQDAIVEKEKQAADLKKKYFGPEGELYKKRSALMSPICHQGHCRPQGLPARPRPCQRHGYHLRLTAYRHQFRGAAQIRLLLLNIKH